MTKSVTFTSTPRPRDPAEHWVAERETPATPKPTKRLTFDLDADVHLRMKLDCARRGVNMADEIRKMLAAQYPQDGQ
jgi:hypothetical protein